MTLTLTLVWDLGGPYLELDLDLDLWDRLIGHVAGALGMPRGPRSPLQPGACVYVCVHAFAACAGAGCKFRRKRERLSVSVKV